MKGIVLKPLAGLAYEVETDGTAQSLRALIGKTRLRVMTLPNRNELWYGQPDACGEGAVLVLLGVGPDGDSTDVHPISDNSTFGALVSTSETIHRLSIHLEWCGEKPTV